MKALLINTLAITSLFITTNANAWQQYDPNDTYFVDTMRDQTRRMNTPNFVPPPKTGNVSVDSMRYNSALLNYRSQQFQDSYKSRIDAFDYDE
ncbi:hypothetical protein [Methylobacter sp. YRD-M1]|uniref:hypothetical protein n=1 Tax=Methylobacter sp. YRD-M1 TaxID=2911520 RepID=UPI00227C1B48|nr:hypothetical protein [Methylobacter sp. YRD-M1]WAK01848.1 hypothetical protein LZ558_18845 [Methylobacter sp. YRD-M1]